MDRAERIERVTRCARCVLPNTKPDLYFDAAGVCDACRSADIKNQIDWSGRESEFRDLVKRFRGRGEFDCIIPVSGGKDSTYQVIKALEYGLKPLGVTFQPTLQTDLGRENLRNLVSLGIGHINFTPNQQIYRAFGLEAFRRVGDHEWPNHLGIFTTPIRLAVALRVPLVIWGENSQLEYGGPANARAVRNLDRRWLEEFGGLLGNRPRDMLGVGGATEQDLIPYTYPEKKALREADITSVFLGYFFKWDARAQVDVDKRHGWKSAPHRIEGTYTDYENLDDAIVAVHDYMKFVKFGFGRASDHASIDIRNDRITREEGMEMVRKYDGELFPETKRLFCSHYGITEADFDGVVEKYDV